MNIDQINRWLTLAANLGVIAGILLLYFEIQQNNDQLAAQSRALRHELRSNDANRVFFDDQLLYEALNKTSTGEELSGRERFVLQRWVHQTFLNWEFAYFEYTQGYVSEEELNIQSWQSTLRNHPFMIDQWELSKESRYSESFIAFVQTNIL